MAEFLNSYGFWFFLGGIPFFVGLMSRPRKILWQDDLRKISSRYREIDKTYNRGTLLFLLYLLILISIWIIGLDEWSKSRFGVPFYPFITISIVSHEIFLAVFATQMDVYPRFKSQSYDYAKKDVIHNKAKRQIYICIGVILFSIVLFMMVFK